MVAQPVSTWRLLMLIKLMSDHSFQIVLAESLSILDDTPRVAAEFIAKTL
jgi:hypothetical protein